MRMSYRFRAGVWRTSDAYSECGIGATRSARIWQCEGSCARNSGTGGTCRSVDDAALHEKYRCVEHGATTYVGAWQYQFNDSHQVFATSMCPVRSSGPTTP